MHEAEPTVEREILALVNENWQFFASWDNGTITTDRIDWLDHREWDDRVLVNDQIPGAIEPKAGISEGFVSMHGRFADDHVSPRIELLFLGVVAPNVYVVTYRQYYDFASGKITHRVITEVLVRKGDDLRVQYIHE